MNPDILKTIYTDVRGGLSFEQVCAKHLPDVSKFVGHTLVCARQGERSFVELLSASECQAAQKEDFRFTAPQWTATTCANSVTVVATCPYKIHDLVVKDNLLLQDYIKHAVENPPEECAICKDDLFVNEREFLPCAHYYHKSCLATWMKTNNTCPICRAVIDESKNKNPFYYFGPRESERDPNMPFTFSGRSSSTENKASNPSSRSSGAPSRRSDFNDTRNENRESPFGIAPLPTVHIRITTPFGSTKSPFGSPTSPFGSTKSPIQVVGVNPPNPFSLSPQFSNPFPPPSPFCNYTAQ